MPYIQKKTKTSAIGRIITFILLAALLVGLSFLAYLKSQGYEISNLTYQDIKAFYYAKTSNNESGSIKSQIEYSQSDHPIFTVYKDYIVRCTADSIKYYSQDGTEVFTKNISLKNPIIKTNGKELLVADTSSKDIYVFKDKDVKWNVKVDGTITNAEIDSQGHVAVVHDAKGYKSAVTVFNAQGGPFFTRNIADGIAVNASVSPKGQHVTTTMLDTSGIDSMSQIEVTNILGSPTGEKVTGVEDLLYNVLYMDSELAMCIGSKSIVGVDANNKEKWHTTQEDYRIASATKLDGKNALIVAVSNEKSLLLSDFKSKILKVNTDGKVSEIYSANGYIKNISCNDGVIGVNLGNEITFISSSGKQLGSYTPKIDVSQVSILSSNEAAVVTKTAVEIIKIN
jgi:hypothetical protein